MSDVAFLLLTFFILTAQFRSQDAASIETPSSISGIKVPDNDIMTIGLGRDGKVYFGIDNARIRVLLCWITLLPQKDFPSLNNEKKEFSLMSNFGLPINQLKSYLNLPKEQQAKVKQPGIPTDSTGAGPTTN